MRLTTYPSSSLLEAACKCDMTNGSPSVTKTNCEYLLSIHRVGVGTRLQLDRIMMTFTNYGIIYTCVSVLTIHLSCAQLPRVIDENNDVCEFHPIYILSEASVKGVTNDCLQLNVFPNLQIIISKYRSVDRTPYSSICPCC